MTWCYFSPEYCTVYGFPSPDQRVDGTTVHGQQWIDGLPMAGAWNVNDFKTMMEAMGRSSPFAVPSYCARPTPPSSPPPVGTQPPQTQPPQSAPQPGNPGTIDVGGAKGPITGDRCAPALQNSVPTLTGPDDDPRKTMADKLEAPLAGKFRFVDIPATMTGTQPMLTRPAQIVFNPDGSIKGIIPGTGPGFAVVMSPELGIQHVFGDKGAGGANDFAAFPSKLSQTGLLLFNDAAAGDDAKAILAFGKMIAGVAAPADGGYFDLDVATGIAYWRKTNSAGAVTASYSLEAIGSGGAPTNAQYLTLATDATLTDERVFTLGNGLDAVDGGAGGNYTVTVDETELDHNSLANLTTGDPHTQYLKEADAASTTEQLTGTETAKYSTPDSVAALWEQAANIASADPLPVGEGGYAIVTGTTTIADIAFTPSRKGRSITLMFAGALQLTHNASQFALPSGANITTATGDTACFVQEDASTIVRCVWYQRADGTALVGGASTALTAAATADADNRLFVSVAATRAMEYVAGLTLDPANGNLLTTGTLANGAQTTTQATLGDPVATVKSTATNDDPSVVTYQNRVTTTDATPTTLHSQPLSASKTTLAVAHVVGRRTGGAGGTADDGCAYRITAAFHMPGGVGAGVGAPEVLSFESDTTCDATIDTDGTDIRVRVTGPSSANVDMVWHLSKFEVMEVGT